MSSQIVLGRVSHYALWAVCIVSAGLCTRAAAVPLNLSSGAITIDTDALTISGSATATGVDVGGVATFTFDSISLTGGPSLAVTLQGSRPLSLQSASGITIGTTLDFSGGNGVPHDLGSAGGTGILGGSDGGSGGFAGGPAAGMGGGPGGGGGQTSCCGGGSGGGHGGMGGVPNTNTANAAPAGAVYGSADLATLLGGSGGGGGAGSNGCCDSDGGGGGAGGGALDLTANFGTIKITSTAQLLAIGGDGAGGNLAGTGSNRNGGGGSGGGIRLNGAFGVDIETGALVSAEGGVSHPTSSRGGGGGGGGRIAVNAPLLNLEGVVQSPGLLVSSPALSVLGGIGSTNPQGGTPGLPGTISFTQTVAPVPEPSTGFLLVAVGIVAARGWRRRR